ncbi:SRPBCC family protein [Streptomyces sp. NPDC052676]|uniref:SRPBCC family protein n=1 Tax=Streptomyces sp. NPDC052676 TaxID=3154953 RepID=UPI00342D6937
MAEQKIPGGAGTLGKAVGGAGGQGGATDRLKQELQSYIEARVQVMLEDMGHRMGDSARRLSETKIGPGGLATAAVKGGKALRRHIPVGGVLTSVASHAKDAVLDKAKDVTNLATKGGGSKAGDKTPDAGGKGLTIIEDIDVGVPVREAYDQWTQFQEFERFSKGVVHVEQEDDTTTTWQVKVAKASRRWRGTITEQVPDERIAWTSEGEKATTKGVVTFHPIGDNLTKVLLVLRYYPKGPVERLGSLVRAQGRRARLDLKLYRTFVMLRGEATGGWRGEIRDSEVVRSPEEVEEAEKAEKAEKKDEAAQHEDEEPEDAEHGEEKHGEDEEDYEDEEEEDEEDEEEEGEDEERDERERRTEDRYDEDDERDREGKDEYADEDDERGAVGKHEYDEDEDTEDDDADYASDDEDYWDEDDDEGRAPRSARDDRPGPP